MLERRAFDLDRILDIEPEFLDAATITTISMITSIDHELATAPSGGLEALP